MKIIILSCFLALDSKYDTFKPIRYFSKKLWGSQNGTNCIWTILWGDHFLKSTNIFIVQNFGVSSQYQVFTV